MCKITSWFWTYFTMSRLGEQFERWYGLAITCCDLYFLITRSNLNGMNYSGPGIDLTT